MTSLRSHKTGERVVVVGWATLACSSIRHSVQVSTGEGDRHRGCAYTQASGDAGKREAFGLCREITVMLDNHISLVFYNLHLVWSGWIKADKTRPLFWASITMLFKSHTQESRVFSHPRTSFPDGCHHTTTISKSCISRSLLNGRTGRRAMCSSPESTWLRIVFSSFFWCPPFYVCTGGFHEKGYNLYQWIVFFT